MAHDPPPRLTGLSLALETAVESGSVALLQGETLLGERALAAGHQAAGVLVALDALLREHARALDEVEWIALSIGPGSFTGLRVGLATALGLSFSTQLRIAPVPTLAALSLQAGAAERISPLLDARKGEVYAALYAPDARELVSERVCAPREWLAALPPEGEIHFLGTGAEPHRASIVRALGRRAVLLPPEQGRLRAASVGRLGARIVRGGGALAPERVELRYLRPPDAALPRSAGHLPGERIL